MWEYERKTRGNMYHADTGPLPEWKSSWTSVLISSQHFMVTETADEALCLTTQNREKANWYVREKSASTSVELKPILDKVNIFRLRNCLALVP